MTKTFEGVRTLDTKRIFVLGNGFDLAHYLPTAYVHFMSAMKAIEECEGDKPIDFDELYKEYLTESSLSNEDNPFKKTKDMYLTDNFLLSGSEVNSLKEDLNTNGWYQHFKHHLNDVDTWIDFENEIESVLLGMAILLDKDFEHNTIIDTDIKLISENPLLNHNVNDKEFLDDNLVQFSPTYLNVMKFKSSQIQRILHDFSILFKDYGSYERVNDFGEIKFYNFKSHRSNIERTKTKENTPSLNSTFMEFEINNLIERKYLTRFSTSYISFNSEELYKKLLKELENFTVVFRRYINLIIHALKPKKTFYIFDDLEINIEAVYTFNYSNTFKKSYPSIFDEKHNHVKYIHGSAQQKNIVLGISDLDEKSLKKHKIYGFVKTFQKLINNTDYRFLDDTDLKVLRSVPREAGQVRSKYEIIIWGHSLDESDSEYIKEIFTLNDNSMLNSVIIQVWYHKSPHTQLANLMHIMGKDIIQQWMKKGWLVFESAPDIYEENQR